MANSDTCATSGHWISSAIPVPPVMANGHMDMFPIRHGPEAEDADQAEQEITEANIVQENIVQMNRQAQEAAPPIQNQVQPEVLNTVAAVIGRAVTSDKWTEEAATLLPILSACFADTIIPSIAAELLKELLGTLSLLGLFLIPPLLLLCNRHLE